MRHILANMKFLILLIMIALIKCQKLSDGWGIVGDPLLHVRPCEGDITLVYVTGLSPAEENQYSLRIGGEFPKNTKMQVKFDSGANVTLFPILGDPVSARIRTLDEPNSFEIKFFQKGKDLALRVKGVTIGQVPYLKSLVINTIEYCKNATTGYLDRLIQGNRNTAESTAERTESAAKVVDTTCGKRQVLHTGLIVNGQPTKPGDWPWHAALYVLELSSLKYICGGTLLSKSMVLTAAHCVTIRGVPRVASSLSVVLGKYNLIGGDIATQEREVQEIIVHESFEFRHLNEDIALVRLKSEAIFDEYVQPACLWSVDAYKRLPPGRMYGTVVGWGFDNSDTLTPQLQQVKLPKVSEVNCIRSNPLFFSRLLTDHKFCAGYTNGTSACNGDSGGGFMIFVPDESGASGDVPGSWHVRGIVSMSVSRTDGPICNPNYYGLFTDVAKFRGWVSRHL
ncbi:hypothetical protein O3G_MSEX013809 [Manduca sexta]|uniref:Peptidase S1 domain-containing protein n=1 Tax=Manduca sexta TaxID=7130 RepID=A0A922CXJ0_MANSE|nr:hypothetical protein O3G_MSEX013809 [Manduca sexta]